jgi:hypothetical protein
MKKQGTSYYARGGSRAADFWTILHPPYTIWNLSYVVIGSAMAQIMNWTVLVLMLLAFLCGTGIAAHALDELNGHPLKTGFSSGELKIMSGAGLAASFILALILIKYTSPFILVVAGLGIFFVLAYNLEWWKGRFHTDLGFALTWGAFPLLAGYWSQTGSLSGAAVTGAAAATLLSLAQRSLSTRARFVRRKVKTGKVLFHTESSEMEWDSAELLASWEKPLQLLSRFVTVLAFSLLILKI